MVRFKKIETGWQCIINSFSTKLKTEEVYEENFEDYKLLAFDWVFNSDIRVCVVLDKNGKVVFTVEHHTEPEMFTCLEYIKEGKHIEYKDDFKRIAIEFMLTNNILLCVRIEEILTTKEKIKNDK